MIIINSINEYSDIELRNNEDYIIPLILFSDNLMVGVSSNSTRLTQGYLTIFHLLSSNETLDIDTHTIYSKPKLIRVNKFDDQYLMRFTARYSGKYSIIIKELVKDMPISVDNSANTQASTTITKTTVTLPSTANTPFLIAASDNNRKGLSLMNKSGGTWYIGVSNTVSASNYFYKITSLNTLIEWLPSDYTGEVWAICTTINANIEVSSFT